MTKADMERLATKLVRMYTFGAAIMAAGSLVIVLFGVSHIWSWRATVSVLSLFILLIIMNLWGRRRFKRVLTRSQTATDGNTFPS
jgi:hypothetical protein